jgi:hypothetical protein
MKIGQNDNFAALNDEDTGSDLPKFGDDSNGNEVNLKASLSSQFKLSQLNTQIKSNLYEYENGNFVIADVQL